MLSSSYGVLVIAVVIKRSFSGDMFTSTAHLSHLLNSNHIQAIVEKYIQREEGKIAVLKSNLAVLDEMRASRSLGVPSPEHPIGVYHILRAYIDINSTIHDTNSRKAFYKKTYRTIPDADDLVGACLGIIRLHTTFKLSARDLIRGRIGNSQTKSLQPHEAWNVAKTAYDNNFFDEALDWFVALYDMYKDALNGTILKNVLLHTAYCYEQIPDVISLKNTIKLLLRLYPNDQMVMDYRKFSDIIMSNSAGKSENNERSDIERYKTLCRGDPVKDTRDIAERDAVCRYRPVRAPYDCVKEEVLSLSPFVLFYYDILTNRESFIIKHSAIKKLETSVVGSGNLRTSATRVSKTAWMFDNGPDDKYGFVSGLSRRIGRITGLSCQFREISTDAEATQVVNYGIGGQYEPHLDTVPYANWSGDHLGPLQHSGNRVATFLLYLSDVKLGGATVFPRAGLRVEAVKNGAVFWYNTLPSGDYDWLTLHAGCPVLLGQKWIANKWFRANGQTFRRPCGLTPATTQASMSLPAHKKT